MERLTAGAAIVRPQLELRVEPVEPARKDPRGDTQAQAPADTDGERGLKAFDLADQVAAIEKLRENISALESNRLSIDRHEESGHFVYRIFNEETGETIRRWPPENYLDLVAFLRDQRAGLLDKKA